MRPVFLVARLTFLQLRRERVVRTVALLSVLAWGGIHLFARLSLGQYARVATDLALGLGTLLGATQVLFLATSLLQRDEEQGVLELLLVRPVSRGAFLWGKLLALGAVLALWCLLVLFLTAALLALAGHGFPAGLVPAVLLLWLKLLLLAAITLFLGTLTSPTLAAFFALGLLIAGHAAGDLEQLLLGQGMGGQAEMVRAVLAVLPRFDLYGAALPVALGMQPGGTVLVWALAYTAAYALVAMVLGTLRLERMEVHGTR
jgi:ABC-type transport system involved in multi-copper enzyme maturation permease subunit